jgi:hypothetical protein
MATISAMITTTATMTAIPAIPRVRPGRPEPVVAYQAGPSLLWCPWCGAP